MRRDEERAEGQLPGRVPRVRPQGRAAAEALRAAPLVTDADRLIPSSAATLQGLAGNAALTRIAGGRAPAAAAGSTPVQRVTEEELHRHPPGPSLRVRGPRKSRKKDKTPNQVEDPELWRTIEAAAGGAGARRGEAASKDLRGPADPEGAGGLRDQLSTAAFRRPERDPQAVQHGEMLEDTAHGAAHRSDGGAPVSFGGQEFPAVFPGMSELLGVPAVTYTDREHPDASGLRRIRPGERE